MSSIVKDSLFKIKCEFKNCAYWLTTIDSKSSTSSIMKSAGKSMLEPVFTSKNEKDGDNIFKIIRAHLNELGVTSYLLSCKNTLETFIGVCGDLFPEEIVSRDSSTDIIKRKGIIYYEAQILRSQEEEITSKKALAFADMRQTLITDPFKINEFQIQKKRFEELRDKEEMLLNRLTEILQKRKEIISELVLFSLNTTLYDQIYRKERDFLNRKSQIMSKELEMIKSVLQSTSKDQKELVAQFHEKFRYIQEEEKLLQVMRINIDELNIMERKNEEKTIANNHEKKIEWEQNKIQIYLNSFLRKSQKVHACLNSLINLCFNKFQDHLNAESKFGQIEPFTQNLLLEQQFLELIIKLALSLFTDQQDLYTLKDYKNSERITRIEKQAAEERTSKNEEFQQKKEEVLEKNEALANPRYQATQEIILKKSELLLTCFQLINAMVEGNKENQLILKPFIPLMQVYSFFIPEIIFEINRLIRDNEELQLNLKKAGDSLITEYDNNELSLESLHQQSIRFCNRFFTTEGIASGYNIFYFFCYYFVTVEYRNIREEILDLFINLCSNNNNGINPNQEEVYDQFMYNFRDIMVHHLYTFSSRTMENSTLPCVHIRLKLDSQDRNLSDVLSVQESDQKEELGQNKLILTNSEVSFVIKQLKFFSGMSLSRNHKWKMMLEEKGIVSFKGLLNSFTNSNYKNPKINAALTKLLHTLFVDQKPMRQLQFPQYCKLLKDIDLYDFENNNIPNFDPQCSDEDINVVSEIQDRVYEYWNLVESTIHKLDKIKKFENAENYKLSNKLVSQVFNPYTLEILKLVNSLFSYGAYSLKVNKEEEKCMPDIRAGIVDGKSEANIAPIMKILIQLLEYENSYPEISQLTSHMQKELGNKRINLGKNVKKWGKRLEGLLIMERSKQAGQGASNETREFVLEDGPDQIEIRRYLKQFQIQELFLLNNLSSESKELTESIKLEILKLFKLCNDLCVEFYLNKIKELFSSTICNEDIIDLIKDASSQSLVDAKKKISAIVSKESKNILPPITLTGLHLDEKIQELRGSRSERESHSFSFDNIFKRSIFPVLILQFMVAHKNTKLKNYCLDLVCKIYSTRNRIISCIDDVQLIYEDVQIREFLNLKRTLEVLNKNCEESETWINISDQQETNYILMETIKILEEFCQYFQKLFETQQNEAKRLQRMHRNLGSHETVISIIRDSLYLMNEDKIKAKDENYKKFFRLSFQFLSFFCRDCTRNQNILSEHFSVFLQDLPDDIGQIDLFIQIFKGNREICENLHSVVTDDFIKWILKYGRRSNLIEFFLTLMKDKNEFILPNQRVILDLFLNHPERRTLLYCDKNSISAQENSRLQFCFRSTIKDLEVIQKDEPFKYHSKIIEMICNSCAINPALYLNRFNVKNLLDIESLFEILLNNDSFIPNYSFSNSNAIYNLGLETDSDNHQFSKIDEVKKNVVDLFYYVYLEGERMTQEIIDNRDKLDRFIDCEKQRINFLINSDKPFSNRCKLYPTYLLQSMVIFVSSLQSITKQKREDIDVDLEEDIEEDGLGDEELQRTSNDSIDSLVSWANSFSKLLTKKIIHNAHFTKEVNEGIENFCTIFNFPRLDFLEMDDLINEPNTIIEDKKKSMYTNKSNDQSILEAWEIFKECIKGSPEVIDSIAAEKTVFSKGLKSLEEGIKLTLDQLKPEDRRNYQHLTGIITKEAAVKHLIMFLRDNFTEVSLESTVTQIIYVLSKMIPLEDDEDVTLNNRKAIEKEQRFLHECGATHMLMTQLSDHNVHLTQGNYISELIEFAIKMLQGGNRIVQKGIFHFAITNTNSESLFSKLHFLFEGEIDNLKNGKKSLNLELVEKILLLIQLFVEGHYLNLQNYLKLQSKSHHSFDIVRDISNLLESYMKKKDGIYYKVILQCFDTLTELIQGPCEENRKSIIQSSFIDLVANLLEWDDYWECQLQISNLRDQSNIIGESSLEAWMIAKIKYKCSITLISLIESRVDDDGLNKISTGIKKEIIERNIIDIYLHFM